ncbi:MAG: TetR/AcrR family transcriptional regulator [Proteobacteria bacterium]|nr:TetR/AcrR family transcriptional regulator [Pseudomonadota bacterium]
MKKQRLSAEHRRLSIIEATVRVVARLNYDKATTALIAKEAKINQATIYQHYRSKLELQIAMLDYIHHFLDEKHLFNPELTGRVKESDFLQVFTIRYHSNLKKDAQLRACILKAMVAIDRKIRDKAWEIVKEKHEAVCRHLQQHYRAVKGEGQYDVEMTAWAFFANDMLFTSLALMGREGEIPREKIYKSVRDFEKTLSRGRKTK